MTDNPDENDTDKEELYSPKEATITISGEETNLTDVEWDFDTAGDNLDALTYALQGASRHALTGTSSFDVSHPEIEADVTITDSEGNKHTIEKATIKSREQVRKEAKELRENAPNERSLGDRMADIDEVIGALQEAKSQGVSEVYVNDDGMTRTLDPRITNNHVRYYGRRPNPGDLEEWVEL